MPQKGHFVRNVKGMNATIPPTRPPTTQPSDGRAGAADVYRPAPLDVPLRADVKDFSFYYGKFQALKHVYLPVAANRVTALIGPSGCGKSTLLRSFNRMHDLYAGNRYEGEITLHPERVNIVGPAMDPMEVRMRIAMVFQKPNPFPKSIFENVAYGLRVRGENRRGVLAERVERALAGAAIWDEVKDRLDQSAMSLSGGQQQRVCIARALATDPEVLLFDEPTSALDPMSTSRIEDLMTALKRQVTVLVVTHNMQQAARVSDYTALMYLGALVEFDETDTIFTRPAKKLTEEYITGRFG